MMSVLINFEFWGLGPLGAKRASAIGPGRWIFWRLTGPYRTIWNKNRIVPREFPEYRFFERFDWTTG